MQNTLEAPVSQPSESLTGVKDSELDAARKLYEASSYADSCKRDVSKACSSLGQALKKNTDELLLQDIEYAHFKYFVDQSDPLTGLTKDRSTKDSASSIAAVGFSLTAHPIAVERGWISRDDAAKYTLKVLNTLWNAPQGTEKEGESGYKGFFYHFLDPKNGQRMWNSELSTIDTALLMAGVLFTKNYFNGDSKEETEIRDLADKLYKRVDWNWAVNSNDRVSMGWNPGSGFLPYDWQGYNEAMILILLGMGSPTHPLPKDSWQKYHSTSQTHQYGGQNYVDFRPLFGHQYSHSWIDFRGIHDAQNKALGYDYFENSRRATLAQNYYAIKNPLGFKDYSKLDWGWTACDGPGNLGGNIGTINANPMHSLMLPKPPMKDIMAYSRPANFLPNFNNTVNALLSPRNRVQFHSYIARGAPDSIDDGTIAPTAAASSIAFAPDVVLPTLYHWRLNRPEIWSNNGFKDAFNPTADPKKPSGWVGHDTLGIDQGPIVLMTENYRSGFVWDVMKRDKYLQDGLKKAGFTGGWIDKVP